MKKQLLMTFICLIIGILGYAQKQKVSVDNDTIKVDGTPYGIIERKGTGGITFDFIVKSLDGKEQIMFQSNSYDDPAKINSGNPNGRVTYYEVSFLNSGEKCELTLAATKKAIAKSVVENHLLDGNSVDADAEKKYILVNGTKFSERKKELAGPKVIIIEK